MPALTAAEREFLANEWRWTTLEDTGILTRHPGAREADHDSFFISAGGATAALNIIHAATSRMKKLLVITIDGLPSAIFKQRPRTVRVFHSRFGGNPTSGELFVCERVLRDWNTRRTTLYLLG